MSAIVPSFGRYFIAVERVEKLLQTVTRALDAAAVRYAVIGGNAVAAWVASKDAGVVRNTKDVDLLLDRADLSRVHAAVAPVGLYLDSVGDISVLLDRKDPLLSKGVHIVFAGEKVRKTDAHPTPSLDASVRSDLGYQVVDVPSLLRMKLIAFRRHDQVHIEDMIRVGLITPEVRAQVPADLLPRLEGIERTLPDWH